jgi:glucose/arabinose dehydrogenase
VEIYRRRPLWFLIFFLFSPLYLISLAAPLRTTSAAVPPLPPQSIALIEYARGIPEPTDIASTGISGDNRLFITSKIGWVYLVDQEGETSPPVVLDIDEKVIKNHPEQGLLGITFDPDFENNGYLYLNYTFLIDPTNNPMRGDTHISRFQIDQNNPDIIKPDSEEVLLTIDQPKQNHNGGDMAFGPDGYLYVSVGDGEGGGDINGNAQDKSLLLGSLIRIDPSGGPGNAADCKGDSNGEYTVPAANPFADGPVGDCDEIWAYGLRNPWRFSFDSQTGDLYVGDVGEYSWEEVDYQPASGAGGENYGWPCYEGTSEFTFNGCMLPAFDPPIYEYPHTTFNAVVGGFVYRGTDYPPLTGSYIFADLTGEIHSLSFDTGIWSASNHGQFNAAWSTFGEGIDQELYLADHSAGIIYKVAYGPEKTYLPIVIGSSPAPRAPGRGLTPGMHSVHISPLELAP